MSKMNKPSKDDRTKIKYELEKKNVVITEIENSDIWIIDKRIISWMLKHTVNNKIKHFNELFKRPRCWWKGHTMKKPIKNEDGTTTYKGNDCLRGCGYPIQTKVMVELRNE